MSRPIRSPIVAIVVGLVGLALSVALVTLMWYLPVPRRWWSLAIMLLGLFALPVLTGLVIVRGLRGLRREIGDGGVSRPPDAP
jgi:hypothetical protein